MPITVDTIVLYDVQELSTLLKIHPRTLRELIRSGKLKGQKIDQKWYVSENNLQEYRNAA
ncbi:helix-turn-helix domain-containing protein [Candidatus Dependentiae bacterium]|nr:helix-turn-helix domain-containing protein [Candidatus Dependentiae bacterium]